MSKLDRLTLVEGDYVNIHTPDGLIIASVFAGTQVSVYNAEDADFIEIVANLFIQRKKP